MRYKTATIVLFTSLFLGSCASKKITDVSYLLLFERKHNNGAEDEHFMPRIQN
jgi:hypothetical protein